MTRRKLHNQIQEVASFSLSLSLLFFLFFFFCSASRFFHLCNSSFALTVSSFCLLMQLRGNIRVMSRVRPFLPADQAEGVQPAIQCAAGGIGLTIKVFACILFPSCDVFVQRVSLIPIILVEKTSSYFCFIISCMRFRMWRARLKEQLPLVPLLSSTSRLTKSSRLRWDIQPTLIYQSIEQKRQAGERVQCSFDFNPSVAWILFSHGEYRTLKTMCSKRWPPSSRVRSMDTTCASSRTARCVFLFLPVFSEINHTCPTYSSQTLGLNLDPLIMSHAGPTLQASYSTNIPLIITFPCGSFYY